MSKLTQIENALKAIDQASFQMLCDEYLHRRGYEAINRIGSAIGKRKTAKGTPDTYIALPNGKFVFAEYTSQESNLYKKLTDDVSKCLNEKKTRIPVTDIQEIILCHNGRLQASERKALATICQSHGCMLTVIGLDVLALDLNSKYPILARDHLGIELDTGQILPPNDFIKEYEKSQVTTPLSTKFRFREEEIKTALAALKENDLLIISGKPGVGKSRFALECGRRFVGKHRSFKFYCILNKSAPLYENLKAYFPPVSNYLILVDDANRISDTQHILHLLNNNSSHLKVKIIITVRDYALEKVHEVAKPYAKKAELPLENFEQKQINELLKAEYNIHNYDYLDRIWRVSKGNPRLAVMAAKIVKEKKTLGSIADVSALYDEYFSSIVQDLNDLKNEGLLTAAGIISLFRVIDRTQENLFNKIADSFNVPASEFWANILKLHEMEIVDLYENDVARVSDQVLSTYLIYKAFIRDQILDFSVVLNEFFDSKEFDLGEYRLKDALYPVLEAFNPQFVAERLQKYIDRKWDLIKHDEQKLLKLMDVFWFIRETHTLFYLKERIDAVAPQQLNIEELNFTVAHRQINDPYLKILRFFDQSSTDTFGIALELILIYLEKNPALTPEVLYLLTQHFSFDRHSHLRSYGVQRVLISKLVQKAKSDTYGEFYSRILLAIAKHYLKMQFRNDWTESRMQIAWVEFTLFPSSEIFELRKELWQFFAGVYSNPIFQGGVLEIISNYSQNRRDMTIAEIAHGDSKLLLPFLETSLDPRIYLHCVIVQDYLKFLEHHAISYKKRLKSTFKNETYKVAQILEVDDKRMEMGWDKYQKYKKRSLKSHFAGYTLSDYKALLERCQEITKTYGQSHEWYPVRASLIEVLLNLGEANPSLFQKVMTYILQEGNPLGLFDWRLVNLVISSYNSDRLAYNLLNRYNYLLKDVYLLNFLAIVGRKKPTKYYLSEFYKLYQSADLTHLLNFDYLEPYEKLDKNVIVTAVESVYNRACQENGRISLSSLFEYSRTSERLEELFQNRVALLKTIYLDQLADHNLDYKGETFVKILKLDPQFIYEYIDWMYEHHQYLSHDDDHRNYNFLWLLDDYEAVLAGVIEYIFTKEKDILTFDSYIGTFFIRHEGEVKEIVEERKIEILTQYIERYHHDKERMGFIFTVITNFFSHKEKELIAIFLKHNKNYKDFKALPLEPHSMSASGSFVPVYEARIRFLEELLPLFSDDLALLQHRLHVEDQIVNRKRDIERESKRNFIEASI